MKLRWIRSILWNIYRVCICKFYLGTEIDFCESFYKYFRGKREKYDIFSSAKWLKGNNDKHPRMI